MAVQYLYTLAWRFLYSFSDLTMTPSSPIVSLDARRTAARPAAEQLPDPIPSAQMTLVDQLTEWARMRIDERVFRAGMRMPSIRQLAQEKSISRFTVVEAYERLVAQGYLESRRGSGFYVKERQAPLPEEPPAPPASARKIDVAWLLRNMFHSAEPRKAPGIGFLPNGWLDGELIANALRALGRQNGNQFLAWGTPQGFLPLRQQLQTRLAELEIGARPDQIVMTSGITQSLDLIARQYVQPGDTVLVGDPAWFLMFGRFAAQGAQVIGVPYTTEGPDLVALEGLVQVRRPKLLVINSVLHNPTGTSLSAAKAFQLLRLAEQYGFLIVEDDIYGDLAPPGHPATRLASLDQLRRVIYLGSFSKTLAANLRVGFIACHPEPGQEPDRRQAAGRARHAGDQRARALQGADRRSVPQARRARARPARPRPRRRAAQPGAPGPEAVRAAGRRHVHLGRHRPRHQRHRPRRARRGLRVRAGQSVLAVADALDLDALQYRHQHRSGDAALPGGSARARLTRPATGQGA